MAGRTAEPHPSLLLSHAAIQGTNALGAWVCVRKHYPAQTSHFTVTFSTFVLSQSIKGDKEISFVV